MRKLGLSRSAAQAALDAAGGVVRLATGAEPPGA